MKIVSIFFSIFIVISSLEANIGKKIKQQSNYLQSKGRIEKKISRKLNDLADAILKQIKNLDKLKRQIDDLNANIKLNEINIEEKYKTLKALSNNNKELTQQKRNLEKKIVDVVAKDFSYYLISGKNLIETSDSIIADEVVEKMDLILKKEFGKLSKNYEKINSKISKREQEIKATQKEIESFKEEKDKLLLLKKRRELAIKKLNLEKLNYKNRLNRTRREKITIRKTLEKLKILKKEENLRIQREKRSKKRVAKTNNSKLNVRQIGSSYQSSKVKRYRGKKTIAPLKNFTVKRKFGNYVDPIYNIKIFNESVTLSSRIKNAKVKNILNGKIVFAKDTAVLDKVIIIENSNGIHTIYAHLSKIAPTIRVGKKIKKGYVIGRVDRDLTFEVTQKNYHINPLQVIRLN